jgi:hypothetical protein
MTLCGDKGLAVINDGSLTDCWFSLSLAVHLRRGLLDVDPEYGLFSGPFSAAPSAVQLSSQPPRRTQRPLGDDRYVWTDEWRLHRIPFLVPIDIRTKPGPPSDFATGCRPAKGLLPFPHNALLRWTMATIPVGRQVQP